MSQQISSQHPAVVLRSHFVQLRALFAAALIAVVGLTGAVVVLATEDEPVRTVRELVTPAPANDDTVAPPGTRYDGGPDEGSRGPRTAPEPEPGIRYDGGPEEGLPGTVR